MLLHLTLVAGLLQAPPWTDRDVLSGNGWYRAEIRRVAGFERHRPERSRWRVRVVATAGGGKREVWSSHYPYAGATPGTYVLSDDGRTLAFVRDAYQDYRAVVTLHRNGRELADPVGNEFRIATAAIERTSDGKRWLADGGVPAGSSWFETDSGPEAMLQLTCLDGGTRLLGLSSGEVWTREDFDHLFRVEVSPRVPERLAHLVQTPFVRGVDCPPRTRAGAPLRIVLDADHPTPGWRFEGFELVQSGDEGRELTLTPRARGPIGQAAQVLQPFRPHAELHGLVPGSYRLRVVGRVTPSPTPLEVEVLPADTVVRLAQSGGIVGIDEELLLLARGELRVRSRTGATESHYVSPEALLNARRVIERLPHRSSARVDPTGADFLHHVLDYWPGDDDEAHVAAFDEPSASADELALVRLLASLRAGQGR